jgi:uncharacterized protein DUF4124
MSIERIAVCAFAAISLAVLATAVQAANGAIYRCLDAHLGVVYTDVPCKDGEAFDTRAGEADPAAVARLEKLRDALDQSAVQRMSDERRLAAQAAVIPAPYRPSEDSFDGSGYDGYYTYPVAGYMSNRPHAAHHHARRDLEPRRGGAPKPPYIVPRR